MKTPITTSIVIPCYNDGEFIHETLNSINLQTSKTLEVIIIDDASNDLKTIKILKKLKQENLTIIFLEKNGGPARARNKGIAIAKGKYILPLDADDKISPTYIEKAQAILEQHTNIGIVYCEAQFFGIETTKWELPSYSFPEILVSNMIFATALYRKSDWITIGGYNENMKHGNEDYDFWLSIIELKRDVHLIEEILFFYRLKESSRTIKLFKNKENLLGTYKQIYSNHKELYDAHKEFVYLRFMEKEQEHNQLIQDKSNEIHDTHRLMSKLTSELEEHLAYARSIVDLRDQQIEVLQHQVQSMRIKNRIKRLLSKILPNKIKKYIATTDEKDSLSNIKNVPVQYQYESPTLTKSIKEYINNFSNTPLISIIMPVYNVSPQWLELAIKSIEAQWYENWELCIADDKSTNPLTIDYLNSLTHAKIKVTFLETNLNISGATNTALSMANGEYIALMDNDDEITPDALYEIVKAINSYDADFIYSDEDFMTLEGECVNPHFKADFSPDLLLSHNYITHFSCFKKSLLNKVGSFTTEFDGAQDYDLFLRLTEQANTIYHIQKVLYHWRMLETSTSINSDVKPEALERGKRVLESTLKRRSISATVEHGNLHHYFRVRYTIENTPLISIVMPFKDKPELLDMSINSILDKSTYENFEIIGISNNSEDQATFNMMKSLEKKDSRVKFYEYNVAFNYAEINNYAVNIHTRGEYVLLLNNDIEIISPDWMESMLEHAQRKEVGCVGAKLYYPNETVQHAGIIIGLGGYAGHSHKYYPRDNPGYFNRLNVIQNVSAVTAACLMIKKDKYLEINGMDEVHFKVAYNDVDFCLRIRELGYLNIFTPYAEMYHHESITRGYETTPEKIARFKTERDYLGKRHHDIIITGDPYYNPNLTLNKEDFSLCLN